MVKPVFPNGTRVLVTQYRDDHTEVGKEGYIIAYNSGEYRVVLDTGNEILATDEEFAPLSPNRLGLMPRGWR